MDRFGPFEYRARGSDTIFIRRVVENMGCKTVAYCPDMVVKHAELTSVKTYYKKIYIYNRSRKSYRHIKNVRPLNFSERLTTFWLIARKKKVRESARLFFLLLGGVFTWWWAGFNVSRSDV